MLSANKYFHSNFNSKFSFCDAVPCLADSELIFKTFLTGDEKLTLSVYKYLEFSDLISLKNSCKIIGKKINCKLLKKYVRSGGISNKTRKDFWIRNINFKNTESLILREFNFIDNSSNEINLYNSIQLRCELELSNNINKNYSRVIEEISRDLNRTFHTGIFDTDQGQILLGRILRAVAYVRPEIGYCQGMNFVAAAIFNFIEDEELSFWMFLTFLDQMELNSLYFKVKNDFSILKNYRICQTIV